MSYNPGPFTRDEALDIWARLVAGWVPGGLPMEPPQGVAVELPAGSRLVLNVHYHATGGGPAPATVAGCSYRPRPGAAPTMRW